MKKDNAVKEMPKLIKNDSWPSVIKYRVNELGGVTAAPSAIRMTSSSRDIYFHTSSRNQTKL